MKIVHLVILALFFSSTSVNAEPVTPPGAWLRMMKLSIRASLGAKDWARISRVYIDSTIRAGPNRVCGRVTATLGADSQRVTRLFHAVIAVDESSKLAQMKNLEVAMNPQDETRISAACEQLGLLR